MKNYRKIASSIFLAAILAVAVWNVVLSASTVTSDVQEAGLSIDTDRVQDIPSVIEKIVANDFAFARGLKGLYGEVCNVLGKIEVEDFKYVLDKRGYLQPVSFGTVDEISEQKLVLRIRQLQDDMAGSGARVIVMIFPSRIDLEEGNGYYGVTYYDRSDYVDDFIRYLRRYNVDYIDCREEFAERNINPVTTMYATDWGMRTEESLTVVTMLRDKIKNEYGVDLDPGDMVTSVDNYNVSIYEKGYRGRMARSFDGTNVPDEDFSYICPDYETEFEVISRRDGKNDDEHGSFEECLVDDDVINGSDVTKRYRTYLDIMSDSSHVINKCSQNEQKLMYIGDKNITTVPAFMTLLFGETELTWLSECSDDYLDEVLGEYTPDYVVIGVTQDSLTDMDFQFCLKAGEKQELEQ